MDPAHDISADIISEAANGLIIPAANDVLTAKDVFVVTDILANAGGIIVSFYEWVQNRQWFSRSEKRVNEELENSIVD